MIPNLTNDMMLCTLDQQIKRARVRFEEAMSERRAHYYRDVYGEPIYIEAYDRALSRRIHWHKQWLDYGQRLAAALPYRDGKFQPQKRRPNTWLDEIV